MMLFSATYNNIVMDFAIKVFNSPMILRLRRNEESLDYIKQFYVTCQSYEEKFSVVMDILSMITVGQTIVFCRVSFIIFFCFCLFEMSYFFHRLKQQPIN